MEINNYLFKAGSAIILSKDSIGTLGGQSEGDEDGSD
jgi:hypothetical protein